MKAKPSLKHVLLGCFISVLSLTFSACSTTFKLPLESSDMETVYLLKYSTWGHHSLAFKKNGKLIEFTYGDWELFALNKRDGWTAWKNMTFFSPGALGRKSIAMESEEMEPEGSICTQFKDCEQIVSFQAPSHKVHELFQTLQSAYASSSETEVYNKTEGVYFVKYPTPYWAFHNCNHELADWLEQLGGEVSGRIFYNPQFIDGMTSM